MKLPRAIALGGVLLACSAAPLLAQTQSPPAPAGQSTPATTAPATAPATGPTATTPSTAPTNAPADSTASTSSADTAAPDAAPPATTQVDNPYGLQSLWSNGDAIARGTLVILAIMSIGTWYIMITKFVQQARLAARGRSARKHFWTAPSLAEGAARLGKGSVYGYIANAGLAACDHHEGTLVEKVDVATWITLSLDRATTAVNSRLQGGLAFLATVGSIAPFVGLFGTVWGIYHALTAIGIAGQASIDKVAGPVGEALIMTAIGLATAVPAVLGYNFLIRRNKAVMEDVRGFTSDLYAVLLSGRRVGEPATAAGRTPLRVAAA